MWDIFQSSLSIYFVSSEVSGFRSVCLGPGFAAITDDWCNACCV
jgi:hypothetical protein